MEAPLVITGIQGIQVGPIKAGNNRLRHSLGTSHSQHHKPYSSHHVVDETKAVLDLGGLQRSASAV